MLRNREKFGAQAAFTRLRRIALLIALGLLVYNLDWHSSFAERFWRESFQTLVHIGVTSFWVLPVIALRAKRECFRGGSGLLHLALSAWFWYDLLHANM
jgi:hypothetical protein